MNVRTYIERHREAFVAGLKEWLAIPSVLADTLDAPLVFVAVGLDDDRIHAPNEKVEVPWC